MEQSPSCKNYTRFVLMTPNRTIRGKRAGFPFFIWRNNDIIIFSQAQWKVRVNETDSDCYLNKYPEPR